MADRQTSILTDSQREHLTKAKSGAAGRMARKRIKERVHEAFHDFPLLVSNYHEEDLVEAFEDRDLENKEHTLNVLSSAFAFLYLGITDTVKPPDLAKEAFEEMIEDGVKQAYLQRGVSVRKVTVDIEVETGPPLEELRNRDVLEFPEIIQLLESGGVSGEEARGYLNQLLQEKGEEPIDDAFEGATTRIPLSVLEPLFDRPEDTEE